MAARRGAMEKDVEGQSVWVGGGATRELGVASLVG